MSAKKTVRIVKKGQLKQVAKAQPKTSAARETARDMVKTVTNWVNELQQKRRAETARALKLMSDTPRPSEI